MNIGNGVDTDSNMISILVSLCNSDNVGAFFVNPGSIFDRIIPVDDIVIINIWYLVLTLAGHTLIVLL